MRTNKTLRIASVLLIAVLMTTCIIGGTFTKYTSTISTPNTSSARVAKWDVAVNFTDVDDETDGVQVNLFNTINDTGNTADEADVADGCIAPGTAGSFEFAISNDSEVTATYAIDYTVTNDNNLPLQYRVKIGTGEFSAWSNTLDDVAATNIAKGANITVVVEWQWVFEKTTGDPAVVDEANDATDTGFGENGTYTVTVAADFDFVQVD